MTIYGGNIVNAQILIVDDDRLITHTLSTGLRSAGYRTVEADSGAAAIKIAQEQPIDLAILDVRMAGMSGLELAQYLNTHRIPYIFLSAHADSATVEQAVASGALGYLVKPLDVPNIVPTIETALSKAKELSELRKKQAELNDEMRQTRIDGAACLASIVDSAMNAIVSVDEAGHILVFNLAAEAMFGCKGADVLGQHLDRFIPERFRAAHHAQVRAFAATGATARAMGHSGTIIGLRADGTEFPSEATITSVDISGTKQLTVMMNDITERLQARAARASLQARLREAQKLEAIGPLAAGIAHDFNNIITAILGNALLGREEAGGNAAVLVSLEEIRKAGTRARSLVRQILSFSQGRQQQLLDQPLRPLVDEAAGLLRTSVPDNVAIAVAGVFHPLYVRADATQMVEVLMNLGTNAWHAMEGQAGRVEIRLDDIVLDAAAAASLPGLQPGRHARLSVSDNGQGMDAATQARMFEPFFTTKARSHGTGLGMAVVHGIVKAHLGAIAVHSTPGEGTRFQLYFPALAAPRAELPPESLAPAFGSVSTTAAATARCTGHHVLFVDHDGALLFIVVRMLESLGYRVSGYQSAEAALAAVRAQPRDFDLVVTDFNMPGLSGIQVAQELARIRPDLPVVIASGYVTEELRSNALQAGVRHIIDKADVVDDLSNVIQRVLATTCACSQQ